MRVTSELWVAAYLRRVAAAGGHAVLARRGAREAGAIHLREVGRGTDRLFSPAPILDAGRDATRLWALRAEAGSAEIDAILAGEGRFDGDLWVVDVEPGDGDAYLDETERVVPN